MYCTKRCLSCNLEQGSPNYISDMTTDNCGDQDEIFLHLQYPLSQKILTNLAKVVSPRFPTLPPKPVPLLLLPDTRQDRLEHDGRASIPGHHSGEGEMDILFGFYCCSDSEPLQMSWYCSLSLACLLQQRAAGTAASTDRLQPWGAIREQKVSTQQSPSTEVWEQVNASCPGLSLWYLRAALL